jgi:hypothetical protein
MEERTYPPTRAEQRSHLGIIKVRPPPIPTTFMKAAHLRQKKNIQTRPRSRAGPRDPQAADKILIRRHRHIGPAVPRLAPVAGAARQAAPRGKRAVRLCRVAPAHPRRAQTRHGGRGAAAPLRTRRRGIARRSSAQVARRGRVRARCAWRVSRVPHGCEARTRSTARWKRTPRRQWRDEGGGAGRAPRASRAHCGGGGGRRAAASAIQADK